MVTENNTEPGNVEHWKNLARNAREVSYGRTPHYWELYIDETQITTNQETARMLIHLAQDNDAKLILLEEL